MGKKIMLVGNYRWDIYEKALSDGFMENGVHVISYVVESWSLKDKILNYKKLRSINEEFVNDVLEQHPDAIFLYRTNDLFPKSIQKIKKNLPMVKIAIFHNDNPYIGLKNKLKYHFFLSCIKLADLVYVYRPSNLEDVKKMGVQTSKLLYPHFYSTNNLVDKIDFSIKKYDVVFIGHYEKNRAESIDYLLKRGIRVKIFGSLSGWKKIKNKYGWTDDVINPPVYGDRYRETLSQAKLALCFLSKINHDVYTRRNFEIPASGTLCVSEYTDELTNIFREDEEILLFKNNYELHNKVAEVLNESEILEIKTALSYRRVINDKHSEINRAYQIINDLEVLRD